MHRCTVCRRPMQFEYVELPRIGLDNKPVQYRNVRRYQCPEGCRGVRLDFSEARPVTTGVRPKIVAQVQPLKKTPDFNDRLLVVGLLAAYLLLVSSLLYIPTGLAIKAAGIAALTLSLYGAYRFATVRVVLPSYFPIPMPPQGARPAEPARTAATPKAPAKAAAPAAAVATPTPVAATAAVAAPAAPAVPAGAGVHMKVLLSGEEFNLDLRPGENMLDAALDRDVGIDYSCREGLCDSCVVKVLAGIENITPPTQEEFDMLGEDVHKGVRLSCQVKVNGPVTIEQS